MCLLSACGATELSSSNKNTPPVIQLYGDAEVTIAMGMSYEDEGAIARDATDGTLPVTIIKTEPVLDALGSYSYTITYGISEQVMRDFSLAKITVFFVEYFANSPLLPSIFASNTFILAYRT